MIVQRGSALCQNRIIKYVAGTLTSDDVESEWASIKKLIIQAAKEATCTKASTNEGKDIRIWAEEGSRKCNNEEKLNL